ncbi:MAG TPA: hypothetical protein VF955_07090, partial [Pyrinomonadaceae bacterium]
KAPPFRRDLFFNPELRLCLRSSRQTFLDPAAAEGKVSLLLIARAGKPEAFRNVLRRSRESARGLFMFLSPAEAGSGVFAA